MGRQWKEGHLLSLVEAVTKVENKRKRNGTIRDPKIRMAGEEKWEQIAAKIPLSVFIELNKRTPTRYKKFAGICKRKFCEICEYFNNVFIKFERNNCLTRLLMTYLAEYSNGFPDQPYFFKTGPRARYIKTDRETESLAHLGTVAEHPYFSNTSRRGEDITTDVDVEAESLAESAGRIVAECSRAFADRPYLSRTASRAKDIKTDQDSEAVALSKSTIPVDCSSRVRGFSQPVSHHSAPFDHFDSSVHTNSDQQESKNKAVEIPLEQYQDGRLDENTSKFKEVEFVKTMTNSQVVRGFLLRLPSGFCTANFAPHVPEKRIIFVLVDEDLVQWKVLYLPSKGCFSAGWGTFAKKHRLRVGDIVRFRLIKPQTFQVTINQEAGDLKTD